MKDVKKLMVVDRNTFLIQPIAEKPQRKTAAFHSESNQRFNGDCRLITRVIGTNR
jgi:hypothetical protein